jgi:hypothetical protein
MTLRHLHTLSPEVGRSEVRPVATPNQSLLLA